MEHVMIIKVDFDGDMRRISMTLPEDASDAETFQGIRTAVAQGFDMVEAALPALTYHDEEADICTLVEASVDDMMQFSKNGTLRLFVSTARVEGPVADETPGKMHRPEPVADVLSAVETGAKANKAMATETTDAAAEQAASEKAEAEWAAAEAEQAAAEHATAEEAAAEQVAAEKAVAEKAAAETAAAEQAAAEQAAAKQAAVEQVAAEWAAAEAEQAVAEQAAVQQVAAESAAAEQVAAKQAAVEQGAAKWAAAEAEQAVAEQAVVEEVAAESAVAEAEQAVAEQAAVEQAAAEQAIAQQVAAEMDTTATVDAAEVAATSMEDLRPTEPLEGSSEQSAPAENSSVPRRPILRNATRLDHFQVFVAKSMFRLRSFAAEVVRPVDCHTSFVTVPSAFAAAEAGNAATAETEDAIDESAELESTNAFRAEMASDEFLYLPVDPTPASARIMNAE